MTQDFALSEVERMIRDGEFKEATTVAALGLLRLKAGCRNLGLLMRKAANAILSDPSASDKVSRTTCRWIASREGVGRSKGRRRNSYPHLYEVDPSFG